mgnify:CR=1 FL=1
MKVFTIEAIREGHPRGMVFYYCETGTGEGEKK